MTSNKTAGKAAQALAELREIAPGLALSAVLAFVSVQIEPLGARATLALFGKPVTITAPVLALLIGIALHPLAMRPQFAAGMTFAVKKLLRWAIALFGLKIGLTDILGLGLSTVLMVVVTMTLTLAAGILFARVFGRGDLFGAIAGAACAVCGASAALATASVLPPGRDRDTDTAFVVIAVNLLATFGMVAYPIICAAMGFDDYETGVFLGASIHDVAQVVGAGYSISDAAGNVATVVKLFRVFLLLPVVFGIGWWFAKAGADAHKAKVPVPVFAIMFVVFAIINTLDILPDGVKPVLIEASRWGLLIAISALGLTTSIESILRVGPRHLLVVLATSAVVFVIPLLWIALLR